MEGLWEGLWALGLHGVIGSRLLNCFRHLRGFQGRKHLMAMAIHEYPLLPLFISAACVAPSRSAIDVQLPVFEAEFCHRISQPQIMVLGPASLIHVDDSPGIRAKDLSVQAFEQIAQNLPPRI